MKTRGLFYGALLLAVALSGNMALGAQSWRTNQRHWIVRVECLINALTKGERIWENPDDKDIHASEDNPLSLRGLIALSEETLATGPVDERFARQLRTEIGFAQKLVHAEDVARWEGAAGIAIAELRKIERAWKDGSPEAHGPETSPTALRAAIKFECEFLVDAPTGAPMIKEVSAEITRAQALVDAEVATSK